MQFQVPSVVHAVPAVMAPDAVFELLEPRTGATTAGEETGAAALCVETGEEVTTGAAAAVVETAGAAVTGVEVGVVGVEVAGVGVGVGMAAKTPPAAEVVDVAAAATEETAASPLVTEVTTPLNSAIVSDEQELGPENHPVRRLAISEA